MFSSAVSTSAGGVAFYVGIHLQDILYGIALCLYFRTMHLFFLRRRAPKRSDKFYVLYSTLMLCLLTIWVAVSGVFGLRMWLLHPNDPSVQAAWAAPHGTLTGLAIGTIVFIQQLTDGLMMYRYSNVWDTRRAIVIPFILALASLALGIVWLWTVAHPTGGEMFKGNTGNVGFAYYLTSVILHAILTTMLCYQIVRHARRVKKFLGKEHAAPYLDLIVILVESVLPIKFAGIAFLVSFGLTSPAVFTLQCVYVATMVISPQMLILRVAQGTAWDKDAMKPLSVLRFNSFEGRGDAVQVCQGPDIQLDSLSGESPSESGRDDKPCGKDLRGAGPSGIVVCDGLQPGRKST